MYQFQVAIRRPQLAQAFDQAEAQAAAAMDGTARQPQSANDIRTSMIIAAALIEGATFFGLAVCILMVFLKD